MFAREQGIQLPNRRGGPGSRPVRVVCGGCRKRLALLDCRADVSGGFDPAFPMCVFEGGFPGSRIRDGVWRCGRCGRSYPLSERRLIDEVSGAIAAESYSVVLPL